MLVCVSHHRMYTKMYARLRSKLAFPLQDQYGIAWFWTPELRSIALTKTIYFSNGSRAIVRWIWKRHDIPTQQISNSNHPNLEHVILDTSIWK